MPIDGPYAPQHSPQHEIDQVVSSADGTIDTYYKPGNDPNNSIGGLGPIFMEQIEHSPHDDRLGKGQRPAD